MLDPIKIKKAYPQPVNTTYLNTSSFGLVSKTSIDRAKKLNEGLHTYGSKQADFFLAEELPLIRKTVSTFIDAPVDEIALVPNFSYGLCAVIPAISRLKRVLLFKDDYPSLIQPFLINDFDVFRIDTKDGFTIDLEELKQSVINNKIEILAISHVQYKTGFLMDIEDLETFCKQHKILFILDGTQSLGAIPFSFNTSNVNIFITSNYKWMNGGYGTGIMCMKKATIEKYVPKIGGFNSYKILDKQWKYNPSIHSYEPGYFNIAGLALLKDALDFKIKIGLKNIAFHNLNLLNRLIEKIDSTTCTVIGPSNNKNRCNIVGISGDKRFANYLDDKSIVVKMSNEIIRIGIHFYNTEDDVDCLVESLRSF